MDAPGKNIQLIPIRRSCAAGAAGIGIALVLTLLCALCLNRQLLPQGREGIYERGILFLASICAAFLSCRKQSGGKAACAGISGGILLLYALFLGIIMQTSSPINISFLLNLLSIIFGVSAGCLLTLRRKKRRRRK